MGTHLPLPKKRTERSSLIFGPCLLWKTAGWIKIALGMEVGIGPGHIVLDEDTAPLPGTAQSSAHFYCGQTARCIKMPLGMEVGLGLCDIVLDGDPAPPPLSLIHI